MTIKKTPATKPTTRAALRSALQDVQRRRDAANTAGQRVAALQQKTENAELELSAAIEDARKAEAVLLAHMARENLPTFKVGDLYAVANGDRLELLQDPTPDITK